MSTEANQDGTESFVVVSEDTPVFQAEAQEVETIEEQASSEEPAIEAEVEADPEGEAEAVVESEDTKSSDDATAEPDKPGKKGKGVQKRIDKLTGEREDAKRKAEALQKRVDELEGKSTPETETKEPVEGDYETYDDYLNALDTFDSQTEAQKAEVVEDKSGGEDNQNTGPELTDHQKTAMAIIGDKVGEAKKPDDFEAIALDPELPVTGEMLEALAECEDPAKVMYHLGKNKDLAAEIATKTPAQVAREIAMLDLTVKAAPIKPTKNTKAPDPISPVRGSDVQEKSLGDMSYAEYEAHMNRKERGQ